MSTQLVKFSAGWCGPCAALARVIKEVELPKDMILVEVDIEQEKDRAMNAGIRGLPTLVLMDAAGNEVKRKVGAMDKTQLQQWLAQE